MQELKQKLCFLSFFPILRVKCISYFSPESLLLLYWKAFGTIVFWPWPGKWLRTFQRNKLSSACKLVLKAGNYPLDYALPSARTQYDSSRSLKPNASLTITLSCKYITFLPSVVEITRCRKLNWCEMYNIKISKALSQVSLNILIYLQKARLSKSFQLI